MKEVVLSDTAPTPLGVFSQGIKANNFVFVSGQECLDPGTNDWKLGTIEDETQLTLSNIQNILKAAGCAMSDVVKCNVYLADINDFDGMNSVYKQFFSEKPPARTTIGCALGGEIKVEIDVIACVNSAG